MKRKILTIIAVGSILCMALTGCVKFSYGNPAKADTTTEDEEDDDSTVKVTKKDAEKIKKIQEALGMTKEAVNEETEEETGEAEETEEPEEPEELVDPDVADCEFYGKAGENVRWFYKDGVVTFKGSGDMDRMIFTDDETYGKYEKHGKLRDLQDKITSVVIEDGITSICSTLVTDSVNLTSVSIPNGVTYIGAAFSGCTSLEVIELPESLVEIDGYAFSRSGLKNVVIPDSVTELGGAVFKGCESLESVTLPNGITEIKNEFFEGCTALKDVVIPEGVKTIGASSFKDCTSLATINIPKSVSRIRDYAFKGCTSLDKEIKSEVQRIRLLQ